MKLTLRDRQPEEGTPMPIHDWTRVDAGIFHHFHQRWIGSITDVLNQRLLPRDYYALAEQHGARFEPDVLTLYCRSATRGDIPASVRSRAEALADNARSEMIKKTLWVNDAGPTPSRCVRSIPVEDRPS